MFQPPMNINVHRSRELISNLFGWLGTYGLATRMHFGANHQAGALVAYSLTQRQLGAAPAVCIRGIEEINADIDAAVKNDLRAFIVRVAFVYPKGGALTDTRDMKVCVAEANIVTCGARTLVAGGLR